MKLNTYTCNNFIGHNPVGTAAVIVAPTLRAAEALLRSQLAAIGLPQHPTQPLRLELVQHVVPRVTVLCNGDY